MRTHKRKLKWLFTGTMAVCLLTVFFLLFSANPVSGVVLHPDGEPNLATWTDRPDPNVAGRWSSSASCVAVSSNCVITTRHQGGGIDTEVEIAGNTYLVSQIWNHSTADIRVARLYGANLTSFVAPYTNTNEIGKSIVIGGFGDGRGSELITDANVYGYTWDNSGNMIQRWGQNKVNSTVTAGGTYTSDVIESDFDGLGEGNSTTYEGIIAGHDSGGGFFIHDGAGWKVAGLSRSVEHLNESWFRKSSDPNIPDPDEFDAVRVSSYAEWIASTIPETWPGDLTGDDWVDFYDFAVFGQYWQRTDCNEPDWCAGADSEPDGDIDWDDLFILSDNWLTGL